MPFRFLNYLQPTHYFRLFRKDKTSVFPKVDEIQEKLISQVNLDHGYQSKIAKTYDQSWRLIQKGYIGQANTYTKYEKLPVIDEYHFIRKNFHKIWVLYVLIVRLLLFKNPLKELSAYWKTRLVNRVDEHQTPFGYQTYMKFTSELIQQKPLVSVIIPTLNRYNYLRDALKDLELQDFTNFEVIIIDQSQPFQKEFYNGFDLNLHPIYQEEKALWRARNKAIELSKGDYILLFDDDSRVEKNWITHHLKTLDYFKADLSSGVSISMTGAKVPKNYVHFGVSSQLDTGNVLLKKEIFRKIGLFDTQFEKQRMGDGEFGLRAYLAGYLNISNPYAKRLHLKVKSGGLRQMGSWDSFRPKNWLHPRPIPSVLYLFRTYHGDKAAKLALMKTVPSSILPYRYKQNSYMMLLGSFVSIIVSPLVLFQVWRSCKLANIKIKQGAKIKRLE